MSDESPTNQSARSEHEIDHEKIREAYQTLADAKDHYDPAMFDDEQVDEAMLLMQQALPEFPHGEA